MTEVIDSREFSEFCRIDSTNQVPDGDTIGSFHNILLKKHTRKTVFASSRNTETKRIDLKKGTEL